ncbi:hypothetical protein [Tahibacter amnicola]|uniref:Uncharacterized protein n=1 Tax=Tahibacter amnicola TaxID=2976241 RepID=A0ABY6BK06_9GAMM|nr:hypothetical protein [Tahibacter amnicola]UXI70354.1 hypothetical protein N4264_12185 [Tahibacter amnicola]
MSYRDFVRTYHPATVPGADVVGFYHPSHVKRMADVEPWYVEVASAHAIDSTNAEYHVYGVAQDDSTGRTRYLADALVVGKYGTNTTDFIVLYPQSLTADGEMEAALIYPAGEFRAPSFAELMRQLSYLQTRHVDDMPPYAQTALVGTCAAKLVLRDVWWK